MTAFWLTNGPARRLLAAALFLTVVLQLALCLYQRVCHVGRIRRNLDGALLLLLTAACAGLMAANNGGMALSGVWTLLPLAVLLLWAHAGAGFRRARRASRETLSLTSVRETLDNLNAGILFADADRRAVLVNHAMGELCAALCGSYPQTLDDLSDALRFAEPLPDAAGMYRFPDGRIWRIQTLPLTDPELKGFTQTTAQEMTELYAANRQLADENAALRAVIEETKRMIGLVAERVREQETLDVKARVHNDIGKSLIALSELMSGGEEDRDAQLRTLHVAVSLFSGAGATLPGTLEEVRREASELRVTLLLDGVLPQSGEVEALIAAAARECVTNCVRHAKGHTVTVRIDRRGGAYTAVLTNDGAPPAGPIHEGGGLSSLRRSVEAAGGERSAGYAPAFALTLKLKERSPEA